MLAAEPAGIVKASAIVEVDLAEGPRIVAVPEVSAFFDRLASYVKGGRNSDRFHEDVPSRPVATR